MKTYIHKGEGYFYPTFIHLNKVESIACQIQAWMVKFCHYNRHTVSAEAIRMGMSYKESRDYACFYLLILGCKQIMDHYNVPCHFGSFLSFVYEASISIYHIETKCHPSKFIHYRYFHYLLNRLSEDVSSHDIILDAWQNMREKNP